MKTTRIIQLSPLIANQIAAGEVIERPASVVKELVENSIDAHATKIEVEIEGGGMHLIRVRDNGQGIVKSDLSLAFARHATSKIRTQADLEAIVSMGFRGEALASIASVSRCRLLSQQKLQEDAWQIQFAGDLTPIITPAAHPIGTTVEVADLFYNTLVRRKFLRSEKTEFQAIDDVFKRLALAHQEITFSLKHQQRQVRYFPKASNEGSEKVRLAKICGQQFINQALHISMQAGSLSLRGWLGSPALAKRQGDCQYFFVNRRMIKDRLLNHVIRTIYQQHPLMVEGSYPSYVLYLSLSPHDVDVNVHPTKQEVKFANARMVHDFLSKCVRDTLNQVNAEEVLTSTPHYQSTAVSKRFFAGSITDTQVSNEFYQLANKEFEYPQEKHTLGERFAFLEEDNAVVLVSLYQAKSSLLAFYYETYAGNIAAKPLLFPQRFTLSSSGIEAKLQKLGFVVRIQNHELIILQQPAIFEDVITQEIMETFVQSEPQKIYEALSNLKVNWSALKDTDFTMFIKAWMSQHPNGPWLRLSHEQFEKLIAQKVSPLEAGYID